MTRFNASEIYDEKFTSKLAVIGELISLFSVIYTILLLIIIIKKTPKTMKRFKFYIVLYMIFALLFEFVVLFCPITLLHPFPFVVPNIHSEYSHSSVMFSCYSFGLVFGMCMLDCSVGIIFEKYYVLSETSSNASPKKPFYILGFLLGMDLILLILMNIFAQISFLSDFFILTPDETVEYVKTVIVGLETKIPLETIIIFRSKLSYFLPWEIIALTFYGLFKVASAIIGLYLNMKISKTMLSQIQLSPEVQKANDMLRNIIYIQFIGYFFLLVIPLAVAVFCFFFISIPSNIPTICCRCLIGYGLYDSVFTTLFIRPYRKAVFWPFYLIKKRFPKMSLSNKHLLQQL